MSKKKTKREFFHVIKCSCGMWEHFPSDMQRDHSQIFEHLENSTIKNVALYKCPECKKTVWSEEKELDIEK